LQVTPLSMNSKILSQLDFPSSRFPFSLALPSEFFHHVSFHFPKPVFFPHPFPSLSFTQNAPCLLFLALGLPILRTVPLPSTFLCTPLLQQFPPHLFFPSPGESPAILMSFSSPSRDNLCANLVLDQSVTVFSASSCHCFSGLGYSPRH